MRRWFKQVFMLAIICAFALNAAPAMAELEKGDTAPALSVKMFDGSDFDLSKLKGKVVIVNMWATWCAACREEIPELSAFYRNYHDKKNVWMVALSVDRVSDRSRALDVAQAFHLPGAMYGEATTKFDVPAFIPTTYVIDTNGVVQAVLVPDKYQITAAYLASIIDPLLTPEKPKDDAKAKSESTDAAPVADKNSNINLASETKK